MALFISPFENRGLEMVQENDDTLATAVAMNKKSAFVSDSEISYLPKLFMKLQLDNLFICKKGEILDP